MNKAKVIGSFVPPEGDAKIRAENLKVTQGRLTVTEAIDLLRKDTGEYFRLAEAVRDGEILSYAPGSAKPIKCDPNNRSNDEEVYRDDLNTWLGEKFPRVEFEFAAPANQPAHVDELDYSLLATPTELLEAFGKWGLLAAWFKDLNSRKWLLDARIKKGHGQRGHSIEPLFCPYAVMNGLIGKVRKANRLKPETAWRTLEHKFPKVYAEFAPNDPREGTGY